jgi:endonuclease YncB( thermonuclease family)
MNKMAEIGQSHNDNYIDWKQYNYDNVEPFSFNNIYSTCRVIDIYDADTITCAFEFKKDIYKINVRLMGIDSCELKSNNAKVKDKAYEARQFLTNLILKDNNINISVDRYIKRKKLREILTDNVCLINLHCGIFEKYGRTLGYIYNKNITKENSNKINSYNHILIKNKLAYSYTGNTKITENEQLHILIH